MNYQHRLQTFPHLLLFSFPLSRGSWPLTPCGSQVTVSPWTFRSAWAVDASKLKLYAAIKTEEEESCKVPLKTIFPICRTAEVHCGIVSRPTNSTLFYCRSFEDTYWTDLVAQYSNRENNLICLSHSVYVSRPRSVSHSLIIYSSAHVFTSGFHGDVFRKLSSSHLVFCSNSKDDETRIKFQTWNTQRDTCDPWPLTS